MTERQYAADVKRAIAKSPEDLGLEAWEYNSHGVSIELNGYDPEETPLVVFPDERISYEKPLPVGWLERMPGTNKSLKKRRLTT